MATAMIRCILSNQLFKADEITGSGPRAKHLIELQKEFGIDVTEDNEKAASKGDIVVLSVKPQVFSEVARELRKSVKNEGLIISIMAGVDSETIQKTLEKAKVIRAMPNTPAQVGSGVTVWSATEQVTDDEKGVAKQIFASMGKEFYVKDETYVDMATALSGTGPAYTFLFLESLINAGVHLGFSRKDATDLVYETVLGSVLFSMNSKKHPAELRDMVTSPGGTTADALYEMEKGGFRTVVEKAVYSAYRKTLDLKELNRKKGGL